MKDAAISIYFDLWFNGKREYNYLKIYLFSLSTIEILLQETDKQFPSARCLKISNSFTVSDRKNIKHKNKD